MSQQAAVAEPTELDGRHEFDFIFGRWRIANRKLERPAERTAHAGGSNSMPPLWREPILGGLGNYDSVSVPGLPRTAGFSRHLAPSVRPRDASVEDLVGVDGRRAASSTRPSSGVSTMEQGASSATTRWAGAEVRVRYDWTEITPRRHAGSSRSRSTAAESFEPNWIAELTRIECPRPTLRATRPRG